MNTANYLSKIYPDPPCWALVADVYQTEFNQAVNEYKTIDSSIREIAAAFRIALHKNAHGFTRIAEPINYCVVLMSRSADVGIHHCGVYYEGAVLHAKEDSMVMLDELSAIKDQYKVVEYWAR